MAACCLVELTVPTCSNGSDYHVAFTVSFKMAAAATALRIQLGQVCKVEIMCLSSRCVLSYACKYRRFRSWAQKVQCNTGFIAKAFQSLVAVFVNQCVSCYRCWAPVGRLLLLHSLSECCRTAARLFFTSPSIRDCMRRTGNQICTAAFNSCENLKILL